MMYKKMTTAGVGAPADGQGAKRTKELLVIPVYHTSPRLRKRKEAQNEA